MSAVLLDTNVLSELVRPRPDSRVLEFVRAQTDSLISVVTLHELSYGAERHAHGRRRRELLSWIATIRARFAGRVIDIDSAIAEHAGRLRASAEGRGRPTEAIDALIAASALARGAAVATRNVDDFTPLGVPTIDPWQS